MNNPVGGKSLFLVAALAALSPTASAQVSFRALSLSGSVLMADNSALPEPARIDLVCSGQIQPQAYTKPDGTFSFEVGGDQAQRVSAREADRSLPSPAVGARGEDRSYVSLSGCEVRASLAGYQSTTIKLGRRSVFESPDIGILYLSRIDPNAGVLSSSTTESAPEKARKSYQKAQQELSGEKPDLKKAAQELEKAVKEYEGFADAQNLLGETWARMGDMEKAEECFNKAIQADPRLVPPYLSRALMELQKNNAQGAAELSEKVLDLVPDLGEALFYQGMALAALGDLDRAQESLMKLAYSADVNKFPRSLFILGNILAQKGEFGEAAREHRRYLELEPDSRAAQVVRDTLADWKAKGLIDQ